MRACLVSRCTEYALPGAATAARMRERRAGSLAKCATGADLARLRRIVFARQRGRCACGAPCTILHHIRSAYESTLDQLVVVCQRCHDDAARASIAAYAKR